MIELFGSYCSFLNWEGADIRPQIKPWKIPDIMFKVANHHNDMLLHYCVSRIEVTPVFLSF